MFRIPSHGSASHETSCCGAGRPPDRGAPRKPTRGRCFLGVSRERLRCGPGAQGSRDSVCPDHLQALRGDGDSSSASLRCPRRPSASSPVHWSHPSARSGGVALGVLSHLLGAIFVIFFVIGL
ncbi:hypothetical protein HJG60_011675 [Phyllostomus discolor]|uniref:Uncharacterized protein n=1 Tax=Phyllostomus discolor TaxID=89673 RepID=A0A833ZW98_9CHIR|nr:hypothetical protein HJG60_011675 [Phyllostomus discolor]